MHRRGKHVIARLGRVDVIVRVYIRAEDAGGESRDHLVRVHVRRRAGARLEHIDGEVSVVRAASHVVGRCNDCLSHGIVDDAQLGVCERRRLLDASQRLNMAPRQCDPRNREILDGSLCLRPVQGVDGNANLTHRVVLDAKFHAAIVSGGRKVLENLCDLRHSCL